MFNFYFLLISDYNGGHYTWRPTHICTHISSVNVCGSEELFGTQVVHKSEAQIIRLKHLFARYAAFEHTLLLYEGG
jgi:hypothetical protein